MRAAVGLLLTALLAASGGAASAAATTVSERPEAVALTIYPDPGGQRAGSGLRYDAYTGLAMITEWRTVEVEAGETVLTFREVAEGIVPQTAALEGLPARLIEQNQDYDLLSPGSLIAASLGAPVKRVRTDRATGRETVEDAIIRSGPDGIVLEVDGRFEALGCGGPAERLVFERTPEGLSDKPTLSMRVRVTQAGRYRVRLSYLAVGLLWSANYVGQMRDDGLMDLTGWVTLSNLSGTTFADAPTQFIAGEVQDSGETTATEATALTVQPRCWPMDTTTNGRMPPPPPPPPPPVGEIESVVVTASRVGGGYQDAAMAITTIQSELGDYKLYSLPVPTTVAARQTKQVMMLVAEGVTFERVYRFSTYSGQSWAPDTVTTADLMLKAKNSKAIGLGLPLPGGTVALMQPAPGDGSMLAVESEFGNTAVDAPLEIAVGPAPGIAVRPRQVKTWVRGRRSLAEYEVAVTSDRVDTVAVEVLLQIADTRSPPKIVAQSHKPVPKPGGPTWILSLQPGEEVVLRYTVETRIPPQPKARPKPDQRAGRS